MIPTLIRLPEEEYLLYKELARERGESLAEFFRMAARKDRTVVKRKSPKYSFWNIGTTVIAKGGPKDGSVNHDKFYYEFEEAKIRKFYKKSRSTK